MSEDARKIAEHHSAALDAEKGGRRPGKPPRLAPQGAAKWDFMKGQKAGLGKLRAVGDSCEQLPVGWQWVGWQWGGVAVAVASSCPFVDVSSSCVHWVGSPPCGASSVQSAVGPPVRGIVSSTAAWSQMGFDSSDTSYLLDAPSSVVESCPVRGKALPFVEVLSRPMLVQQLESLAHDLPMSSGWSSMGTACTSRSLSRHARLFHHRQLLPHTSPYTSRRCRRRRRCRRCRSWQERLQ